MFLVIEAESAQRECFDAFVAKIVHVDIDRLDSRQVLVGNLLRREEIRFGRTR